MITVDIEFPYGDAIAQNVESGKIKSFIKGRVRSMVKCKNCTNLYNLSDENDVIVGKWCPKISDSPDVEAERECGYYKRMTRADRIRSMSDEKLAELLDSVDNGGIRALDVDYPCDECTQKTKCEDCFKEWLQSEVEE